MELKEIQELIKFVSKSGVSEVKLEQGDFKILIKAAGSGTPMVYTPPVEVKAPQVMVAAPAAPASSAPAAPAAAPAESANGITIKSPMIGTFYRTPSPDKPMFVNVGDEIKVGQVICIVEAMKLFNEIESEVSGRIVKILVENASPVEYDQPLFIVEPV